jgi:hypothetical protein
MISLWVFTLRLQQMLRVPTHQQSVPRIALESLALMTHLLDSPIHKLLHLENLGGGSLCLLVLRRGNLWRRTLMLSTLLWHPFRMVVHFPPLISIDPNGKLCTLFFGRGPHWSCQTILCLCCNCLDSCFIRVMLCAFTRVYFFFCCYLFSSRISVFTAFKQVLCPPSRAYQLIYWEIMHRLRAIFHFSMTCVPPSRRLSFCVRELDTQLMVVPWNMHVYAGVICFGSQR